MTLFLFIVNLILDSVMIVVSLIGGNNWWMAFGILLLCDIICFTIKNKGDKDER